MPDDSVQKAPASIKPAPSTRHKRAEPTLTNEKEASAGRRFSRNPVRRNAVRRAGNRRHTPSGFRRTPIYNTLFRLSSFKNKRNTIIMYI